MAQVVEFLGAPGTGKSTLVGALDGRTVDGRRLVAGCRLLRVPRTGAPPRARGRLLARDLTPAERRRALAARADDWAGLLTHVATSVGDRRSTTAAGAADPLRQLYAPGWLAATLELRALAAAAPDDRIVMLDEGLAQRSTIVCGDEADTSDLGAYLALLPPTRLHVHLDPHGDAHGAVAGQPAHDDAAELLVARVTGRDRTIDRHAGLDMSALAFSLTADVRAAARTAATLRTLGAPVVDVPVAVPLEQSVATVLRHVAEAGG